MCSSELAQLIPFLYSCGRSTCYSDRLHDFSVTISRCYQDLYGNSFFLCTAGSLSLVPPCLIVAVLPCMELIQNKTGKEIPK